MISLATRSVIAAATAAAITLLASTGAQAATNPSYPSDSTQPDLVSILHGFTAYWTPNGGKTASGMPDMHGTLVDPAALAWNDELTSWINQHATSEQRSLALQDSSYQNKANTAYDQSMTISTSLGSVLGPLYVAGRNSGALPLTSALINSSNGTSGAYVGTGAAKAAFTYPRPFLPVSATASPVAGDSADCSATDVNASALASIRAGKPWSTASGDLLITRVAPTTTRATASPPTTSRSMPRTDRRASARAARSPADTPRPRTRQASRSRRCSPTSRPRSSPAPLKPAMIASCWACTTRSTSSADARRVRSRSRPAGRTRSS